MKTLQRTGLMVLLMLGASVQAATPAAGTVIKNQASASYRACLDDGCTEQAEAQRVTSNLVQTLVQNVPGIELVSDQGKPAVPGGLVYFSHVLTNTGNGRDQYQLCITNVGSDIDAWAVYADGNGDGQPDAGGALFTQTDADGCWDNLTPDMISGETFALVVEAELSAGTVAGQQPSLQVRARSDADNTLLAINTDEADVIDGPVIEVVKSLSQREGRSPDGPITVTLDYRNPSDQAATDIIIEDVLPTVSVDGVSAGMTYVPDSARWTFTGNTPLTDDGDDGDQGNAPNLIRYCAYDTDAAEPDCQDRVRAVVTQLPPGGVGTLTFEVTLDAGLSAGDRVRNTGRFRYSNEAGNTDFGTPSPFSTNAVSYRVIDRALAPAVVANNSENDSITGSDDVSDTGNRVEIASAGQGGTVLFNNVIWNTGDGEDRFDITIDAANDRSGAALSDPFPQGTVFQLLKADGATPLVDTDGNGVPDTGPIPLVDQGGQCPARFVRDAGNGVCGVRVVLQAILPPNALGGPFQVTKVASSVTDPQVRNAVTDTLISIATNSVDLTNDQPVNGSAPGEGPGPEASPVRSLSVAPGSRGTFVLYVNNTGPRQDSYDLHASNSNFNPGQLPAGWAVAFYRDGGSGDCSANGVTITNTGLVPAGSQRLVCAQVTVPESASGGDTLPLYLRALSPTSNASDIKLDQVVVVAGPALSLQPDQTGQVAPGSSVLYSHQLTNTGNVDLTNVLLSGTPDSASDNGWSITLYEDSNGNGQWDTADTLIVDGTPLQTAGADGVLAVGESLSVFARVFAPATAGYGITNLKTLTVTAQGAGQTVTDTATDSTTTSNTDVAVTKEQALDADCDGVPDGPGSCTADGCFVYTRFTAAPGEQCVIYRLTAANTGAQSMYEVTINDRTQPFTTMLSAATRCQLPSGDCSADVAAPAEGGTGDVSVNVGELKAGEAAVLIFGLRVE